MKRVIELVLIFAFMINVRPLLAGDIAGEIIAVRGTAWLVREGVKEQAVRREKVYVGDEIITSPDSYVKIFLQDDSVLTIGEDSHFIVNDFILNSTSRRSIFTLIKGKVKAVISKFLRMGAENRVQINTPTAVAGVRGTEFFVETDGKVTEVGVLDGVVEVSDRNGLGRVLLQKGFLTMVRPGSAPMRPKPLSLTQLRKLKLSFFTGRGEEKKKYYKKVGDEALKIGDKDFKLFTRQFRRMKPGIRRKMKKVNPGVETPISLGKNALVHIRIVFPK